MIIKKINLSAHILKGIKKLNPKKIIFNLHSPIIEKNDILEVKKCLTSTFVSTHSNFINKFEKKISLFTKSKYSIATINATSGLHIALKALDIKKNDEVLLGDLNYIAAANAILYVDATPHMIDINLDNLFIDINKLEKYLHVIAIFRKGKLINKKTKKTIKAIIATYIFGKGGNISELIKIAKKYNIKIIEDASEALGSYYKKKHLGTFGDIGVVSFNGNKIITTGGGGAILTNNFNLYNKCFNLCTISRKGKNIWEYDYTKLGYNYRLPGLNASLGLAQLSKIKRYLLKKNIIYNHYKKYFSSSEITLMKNKKNFNNNNWLNAVFIKDSNLNLIKKIIITAQKKKIMLRPVWKLMHKIEYLKKYPRMKLKNSLIAEKSIITLPSGVDVFQK
jgi:perosamine synthetase